MGIIHSIFGRWFLRDKTIKQNRFSLGQFGKTRVELDHKRALLILGNNSSGRMDLALEIVRQAIAQKCSVLFVDTMQTQESVDKMGYFARRVRREKEFYVKGAFNATPVDAAELINEGNILYCGPSPKADSPEAYAEETGPLFADLSSSLMKRVGKENQRHMLIVMVDVIEAFGGFPQQIKQMPSLLRSLNMSLVCVECSDTYVGTELDDNLDCTVKMQYEGDRRVCTPVGMPKLMDLEDGQALVSMRNARHDIGPVQLTEHVFDVLPVPPAKAVNMLAVNAKAA